MARQSTSFISIINVCIFSSNMHTSQTFLIFSLILTASWGFRCHLGVLTPKKSSLVKKMANQEEPTRLAGNRKGYYVRPSSAIERGGGFFVPGLEGAKIRILSALILAILFTLNALGNKHPDFNLSVSISIGVSMAVILGLQGIATLLPSDKADLVDKTKVFSINQINPNENFSLMATRLKCLAQTVEGLLGAVVLDADTLVPLFEMGSCTAEPAAMSSTPIQRTQPLALGKFEWLLISELASMLPTLRLKKMSPNDDTKVLVHTTQQQALLPENAKYTWILVFDNDYNSLSVDEKWLVSVLDGF